jgi:ADP-ribosyl-[dinitrogen reductase] hydrolase
MCRSHGVCDLREESSRIGLSCDNEWPEHTGAIAALGEGWVGEEALAIGLYAALVAPSFEDAIRIAANHSGDSDSTASIAGQLYGAWTGADELPHRWVCRLDALDPLLDLIGRLIRGGAAPSIHASPFSVP